MTRSARNWSFFALTAVVVLSGGALLLWLLPAQRGLVWLGLYTIPSHMFVSPFPHEPALLYYAKSYPALWCAITSLAGCLVAGMWDYWLFIPLIHHPRVREKYVDTGLYKRSVDFFRKSPFWALVVVGLTPIPFYPIKFLSIADGYAMEKYLAALAVGRTPRYYLIAYLGYVLKLPNWSLVTLALVLLAVALYKNRKSWLG
ncbi:MAG: VTT domain-containing protein [Candidatus Krumholzibacteriia bacterium]